MDVMLGLGMPQLSSHCPMTIGHYARVEEDKRDGTRGTGRAGRGRGRSHVDGRQTYNKDNAKIERLNDQCRKQIHAILLIIAGLARFLRTALLNVSVSTCSA